MIVVLASAHDRPAREFAHRADATRITPADLSSAGWRWTGRHGCERARAGGHALEPSAITGVVCRLNRVPESDLGHIHADDRGYLAAEMTAFLLTWLSELACAIVNPPSPLSLCGPGWSPARWSAAAAAARVLAVPRRWPASAEPEPRYAVEVVDGHALTPAPPVAARLAERLARATRLPALRVHLGGTRSAPRFLAADPWVSIDRPAVADAVLALLATGRR